MIDKEKVYRLGFNLYLDNPEHKKVYDILQRSENKNQLIRDAILAYEHRSQFSLEVPTTGEIRSIVQESVKASMQEIMEALKAESVEKSNDSEQSSRKIDFDRMKKKF